jgi:hypothetical protein
LRVTYFFSFIGKRRKFAMDLFQCGSGIGIDCCHSENERRELQKSARIRHIPGMEWRQGAVEQAKHGPSKNSQPNQTLHSPASADSSRSTSRSNTGPHWYASDSDRSDSSHRRFKDIPIHTRPGPAYEDSKSARGFDSNLSPAISYKDSG